ncbi:carboxypeptidase SOL1 isoform X2 [Cucumis melo var. makuwa]|uniref:Carboxypeptidase SOL1 isoform X2 n=1 Tax=Cucumis melo var. makuwa TaxID=1194695 RepID=A0A5D3BZB2_CUCMM|nr:carboxypeptidase SOL1 isoform X2 [Cucumis melo var. makuwa]
MVLVSPVLIEERLLKGSMNKFALLYKFDSFEGCCPAADDWKGETVGQATMCRSEWDGRKDYYACPDDETFRFMASIYSRSHHNMSFSQEFQGGITNGAAWYPIYGGMQDWNYIHGGCFELTLEITDNKWPPADELPTIFEYNKLSMLKLVASLVQTGIHGRIFSSDSGTPLPATITLKGIDYLVKASQKFADYHRLAAPRQKYEVTASMPGYKSKDTSIWLEEGAMSVDFVLDPDTTAKGKRRMKSRLSKQRLVALPKRTVV